MAGPHLWLKGELGPAVKGAWEVTVGWPLSYLVLSDLPVAGRDTLPHRQGFRVRTGQGMDCV